MELRTTFAHLRPRQYFEITNLKPTTLSFKQDISLLGCYLGCAAQMCVCVCGGDVCFFISMKMK